MSLLPGAAVNKSNNSRIGGMPMLWQFKNAILATTLCCVALSGCAAFNRHPVTFDESYGLPSQLASSEMVKTPLPLVVVRWPVGIDPAIRDQFYSKMDRTTLWGLDRTLEQYLSDPLQVSPQRFVRKSQVSLTETFVKSTYYASEFYSLLGQVIPPDRIVLQPGIIGPDGAGGYTLRSEGESVQGVVYVDFVAFVDTVLGFRAWDGVNFTTAGNMVAPLVSIHTDPAGAPATLGALAGNGQLPPRIQPATIGGARASFWDYPGLTREQMRQLPYPFERTKIINKRPMRAGHYLETPLTNFIVPNEDGKHDFQAAWRPFVAVTVDALNSIDFPRVKSKLLEKYIREYDAGLAGRYASGQMSAGDADNLKLLEQIIDAETHGYAEFSKALVKNILNSEHGDAFRQMRKAELDAQRKDIRNYHAQMIGAMVLGAALGAAGSSAIAVNPGAVGSVFGNQMSVALKYTSAVETHTNSFYQGFFSYKENVTQTNYVVVVRIKDKIKNVSFESLDSLRRELKQIYEQEKGFPVKQTVHK